MTRGETFGAALAIIASVISNLGVNIQKFSHAQDAQLPDDEQKPYIKRPLWWLGLTLVFFGSLGDFAAFGFATQSLVAALGGGSTLVANVVTAYFLNKETLWLTDGIGVIFVICGVVIIAFIAEPNVQYPLPELEKRFVRQEFVIYFVIVVVLAVSMLATIKGSVANRLKNQMHSSKRKQKEIIKRLESRIARIESRLVSMEEKLNQQDGTDSEVFQKGSPVRPKTGPVPTYKAKQAASPFGELLGGVTNPGRVPYYYAICSGIIGSISVLLAKCSAEMIRMSIAGENQFKYPLTYVFLGGMCVCIVIQTHFLNLATSLGDIMTVFPIFQACWITFSVVGGAVFYESEKSFTPEKWALYPLALICIGAGVTYLVQHPSAPQDKIAGSSHAPRKKSGLSSKEYGLLASDEVCLITDASMRSPLLGSEDELDEAGYLHMEA